LKVIAGNPAFAIEEVKQCCSRVIYPLPHSQIVSIPDLVKPPAAGRGLKSIKEFDFQAQRMLAFDEWNSLR
jgi:hypothetical protein